MKIFYRMDEKPPNAFRVGNKAYNLWRIQKEPYRPFNIPPLFMVSTDVCREYFEQAGVPHTEPQEALKEIENHKIADELIDPIYEAAQKLAPPLIVRSSAIIEDSEDRSSAGVFESHRVSGAKKEDLDSAIRGCYASLFDRRAVLDRSPTDEPVMGFLVQEYKQNPRASFVVETADNVDPSNPDPTWMRIASREGGNGTEIITDGTTMGTNLKVRKICFYKKVPPEVSAVINGSLFIERIMGQPQNLEWVVCNDGPYLLQTRPLAQASPFPLTTLDLEREARRHLSEPEEKKDPMLRAGVVGSQVGSLIRAATHLNSINPSAHQVPDEEVRAIVGESFFQMVCANLAWPWGDPPPSLQSCIEEGMARRRQWRRKQASDGALKGITACYRVPYLEGTAYVVSEKNPLSDFSGGILVARDASPALEPAILESGFAAGITDQGDFTSHACIFARSRRKPFVCGTGDATKRIKHESRVGIRFGLDESMVVEVKGEK